jgi:hypothetical protein
MKANVQRLIGVLLLLLAQPVFAAWFRAETPAFVVYGQGSARQVGAAATQLAAFDQLLRQLTGTTGDAPRARVNVYLVNDARDFERLRGAGPSFDGFYTATPNTIAAFVDRSDTAHEARAQGVMFHEYAHHFMFAHQPASYPAWYIEGLASYWETARFSGGKARYGDYDSSRAQTMMLANWMPMARLLGADWANLPGYETPMFYAQSWLAVHYLASDPQRAAALARYLELVAAGTPSGPAFAQVFGYPVERFDKVLIDYVMGRTLKPTELAFVPLQASVAAAPLSAVADALLIPAAQLDIGVDPDKAPALLERIRRIAARYPDDWSAKVVLATAELRLGDRVQARTLIDSLVAEKPDSAPLLVLLGTAQLLDHQAASATLAHADAMRPDDYRILFLRALAEPPGAEAERRALLLRANALAPQVEPVALAAAQAQAEAGEFAAARALLMPVANNPHGGPAAVQARGWLRQLPAATPVDGTIKAAPPK